MYQDRAEGRKIGNDSSKIRLSHDHFLSCLSTRFRIIFGKN